MLSHMAAAWLLKLLFSTVVVALSCYKYDPFPVSRFVSFFVFIWIKAQMVRPATHAEWWFSWYDMSLLPPPPVFVKVFNFFGNIFMICSWRYQRTKDWELILRNHARNSHISGRFFCSFFFLIDCFYSLATFFIIPDFFFYICSSTRFLTQISNTFPFFVTMKYFIETTGKTRANNLLPYILFFQ